jgi:mono/diheme cytochrome c family protein
MNIRRLLGFILILVSAQNGQMVHTSAQAEPLANNRILIAAKTEETQGAQLYAQNCAICHGKTGKADGPAARSLKPSPRDFSTGEFKYTKNDAERLQFIKKGKGPMPAWEKTLTDAQINDIITFIHTLKAKKSDT